MTMSTCLTLAVNVTSTTTWRSRARLGMISIFTATLPLLATNKEPTQTLNLNFEMDMVICV